VHATGHGSRINTPGLKRSGSVVCAASSALDDPLREDASPLIATLRAEGLNVVLASGDREAVVRHVGERLGIDWHAELSPEDKVALVKRLEAAGRTVAFVGDGLNDGTALSAASLGIAVGTASDLARSAAAMSVLDGGLERIEEALALARRGGRTLRANLFWALLYNASMLPAAMLGFVHPVMAVFAMGASSLSVILNSVFAGRSLGR